MIDFIYIFCTFIISTFSYYLLYLFFDFLKFRKIALFCFALSDAPLCGLNAERIRDYCFEYCPEKKCKKCSYWTCANCGKEQKEK